MRLTIYCLILAGFFSPVLATEPRFATFTVNQDEGALLLSPQPVQVPAPPVRAFLCALVDTPVLSEDLKDPLLQIAQDMLDACNKERKANGVSPLQLDLNLQPYARTWAQWMAKNRNMRHSSYGVGENIAQGQPSVVSVYNAWMNSSGHRANILSRGYRYTGVAVFRSKVSGQLYWCQQFR